MMHLYHVFRNGKAQACASYFPGTRFIHPEKALENMLQGILRNADPSIRHLYIEILVIRVQGNPYIAGIPVIFDRIFHQVGDGQGYLHTIHICCHFPDTFQDQLHISPLCNGTEALEDQFQFPIDIHLFNVHLAFR